MRVKPVELGGFAHCAVLPLDGVVSHFDDVRGKVGKEERWRQTAVEALKQCGSPWLHLVRPPVDLGGISARGEEQPEFALIERSLLSGRPASRRKVFWRNSRPKTVALPPRLASGSGPERDFAPAETEAVQRATALFPSRWDRFVLRCVDTPRSLLSGELQLRSPGLAGIPLTGASPAKVSSMISPRNGGAGSQDTRAGTG